MAAKRCNNDLIKLIVELGGGLEVVDVEGKTPVALACQVDLHNYTYSKVYKHSSRSIVIYHLRKSLSIVIIGVFLDNYCFYYQYSFTIVSYFLLSYCTYIRTGW